MNDNQFLIIMNPFEFKTWSTFVLIVKKCLGNDKAENYVELVVGMLESYKELDAYKSIKDHALSFQLLRQISCKP